MNKTPHIFWVILLCVVSYVGLLISLYSSRESDTWNPQQGYAIPKGGRASESAMSVGSNSNGVAVPMTSHHSSALFSSKGRARKYPTAFPQTPSSFQGGTAGTFSSPISHMSSSQTMKSFGGGGTGGSVSVSGGSVQSSASSVAPAAGLSVSMPSTSLYAYSNKRTSSSVGNMLSVSNESAVATVASYAGIGKTTSGGPMGVSGRKNATGMGGLLDDWVSGYIDDETNGYMGYDGYIYYFDYDVLYQLYLEAIANGQLPSGMTWSAFCDWMKNGNHSYAFPISSGTWFMSILALGYALIIYFKKRKLQKQL